MDFFGFFFYAQIYSRGIRFFTGCLKIHVIIVRQPPKLLTLDENIHFVNNCFWPISPPWSIKFHFVRSVYCFCTIILPRKCCRHLGWPWSRLKVIIWDQIDHSAFLGVESGTLGQALFSSIFALWALFFAWFTGAYGACVSETVWKWWNKPIQALGWAIEL